MSGSLLIVLMLGWIAIRNVRNVNREAQLQNEAKTETVTLIKYDKKTVEVTGILFKVAALIFLVSSFLAERVWAEAGIIVFPAGFATIILCAYYWIGKKYLKRLHQYGYIVPENAKDYGDLLENLPKADVGYVEPEPYNRRSKFFGLVCMFMLAVMLVVVVWYYSSWYFMRDNVWIMVTLLALVALVWFLMARKFKKQMNNELYKEDVEIDKNRKNRMSSEGAVFLIAIMILVSGFAIMLADSMIRYIYNSWVDSDRSDVRNVQIALERAYDELTALEMDGRDDAGFDAETVGAGDWQNSKEQLEAGVDITEWGAPRDVYQEKVAEYLGISDFSELKDDFRSAKGEAVLYAELEKGLIRVSLPNLYREVNMPITISSEKNIKCLEK